MARPAILISLEGMLGEGRLTSRDQCNDSAQLSLSLSLSLYIYIYTGEKALADRILSCSKFIPGQLVKSIKAIPGFCKYSVEYST